MLSLKFFNYWYICHVLNKVNEITKRNTSLLLMKPLYTLYFLYRCQFICLTIKFKIINSSKSFRIHNHFYIIILYFYILFIKKIYISHFTIILNMLFTIKVKLFILKKLQSKSPIHILSCISKP